MYWYDMLAVSSQMQLNRRQHCSNKLLLSLDLIQQEYVSTGFFLILSAVFNPAHVLYLSFCSFVEETNNCSAEGLLKEKFIQK